MTLLVGSSVHCEKSCYNGKKLSFTFRGPGEISVGARWNQCCQRWNLPTKLGYFKFVCRGLKKKLLGQLGWVTRLLLGSFEVACRGQKRRFAAVVLWSFGNTDMNHDQFWSIQFWQHGFSIRGVITKPFTCLIANFSTTEVLATLTWIVIKSLLTTWLLDQRCDYRPLH